MGRVVKVVACLKSSHFAKNVAVLATGTALAQAIPVLASPILTRLYSPADFGFLAIFMGLVSSFLPAVCGKYDVALVLPKSETQGKHLFGIAVLFAFVISSLFAIFIFVAHDWVTNLLDADQLGGWLYLTPLVLLLAGLFQASSYFANRMKRYKLMAQSKLVQAITTVTVNIFLGLAGVGFVGLLLGNVLAFLLATCYILYAHWPRLSRVIFSDWQKKRILMVRYKDYPIFNGSSSLLNGITQSLPIFFLAHYFPESIVGYFALVLWAANAPLSFISASVSQVNLKKVVDLVNARQNVTPYIYKLTLLLMGVSSVPALLFVLFAPDLFAFIFGESWREAGVYCQILIPALAIRFVVSTLSTTLGATKNNQYGALWKVIAFAATFVVFAWFAPKGDILILLYAALVVDVLLYILYYVFIVAAAKKPKNLI